MHQHIRFICLLVQSRLWSFQEWIQLHRYALQESYVGWNLIDVIHVHMTLFNVIDIDECTLEIDNCAHDCMNSHGSYTCSCRTGYTLDADGFTCNGLYS